MAAGLQFYEASMTVVADKSGCCPQVTATQPMDATAGQCDTQTAMRPDLVATAALADHGCMSIPVQVRRLPHAQGLPLPAYATAGAAGMDLLAAVDAPVSIASGQRALIPTGLTIALPPGYELQIRPRSGLALRHGITLPNTPGTIDEDYRGEIQIIVLNTGAEPFTVERGARIAQAVLAPVVRAAWVEVETLDSTARDTGGFGSTGIRTA